MADGARADHDVITMTDLSACLRDAAGDGVHWSLEGPRELDANLVHLDAGHAIAEHVNDAVDVLMVVLAGAGRLTIDGDSRVLTAHVVAHVPRGVRRSVEAAGDEGIDYLSIHRRRPPLGIRPAPSDEGGDPACWAHLLDDTGGEPSG